MSNSSLVFVISHTPYLIKFKNDGRLKKENRLNSSSNRSETFLFNFLNELINNILNRF